MAQLVWRLLLSLGFAMLVACSSIANKPIESDKNAGKVLVAVGYSQHQDLRHLTKVQNKFAKQQSAKLNAYRKLATLLYNEKLTEELVVADQVMNDELFRVYMDLYLREAKVLESKVTARQLNITVKLILTARFYQCVSSTVAVVSQCLQQDNKVPFTRIGYKKAAESTVNISCAPSECGSQLHVSGFSDEKNIIDSALLSAGLYDAEWLINMGSKVMLRHLFFSQFIVR
ncbi:MAG: hypothetical protein KAT04_03960 [Methylococcales bacterium]|nr:hypothetical protein [Methylococcales bacterium]